MSKVLKLIFFIIVIAVIVSMCTDNSNEQKANVEPSEKETETTINKEAKASDYSDRVVSITQDGFPKMYKAWGKQWVDKINETMPIAINHVAKSEKCDEPVDIGLSNERSEPRKAMVFYVDCQNGERFYVTEQDLKQDTIVGAESEKLAEPSEYIRPCIEGIKARVNYPATFDEKTLSIRAYKGTSGNVVVNVPFTAKNGFGVEEEHQARCVIDTRNNLIVEM
ncbi:hypothetical protein LU293_03835 [Moraxella nasovis]|uniref:hypothetical protein n=1 Tax=Moraxella nasovis TaxID=2904121 RepID=UPI001F6173FC|nr:hypothetical protein [Moraxella nasovis]UNU74033.1 hypothetical protein LU293_03835 [Moraxella nasovis]